MRLLWMTAFLFCAATVPGMRVEAAPAAVSISCPSIVLIESTNGTYYIAVFESKTPIKVPLDMTLYSKAAVYNVSVPAVDMSKPLAIDASYRSAPQIIKNPGDDELLGATVVPSPGTPYAGCDSQDFVIPSVASLTAPDRHIAPAADALETQLVAESATSTPIFVPTPASGVAIPACNDAFADAAVDTLVKPIFSSEVRNDTTLQSIAVSVQLAATGKVLGAAIESSSGNAAVDAIALGAAKASTYHPERFACRSERSSHVIRVDFSH